jgi:hypothetical protein
MTNLSMVEVDEFNINSKLMNDDYIILIFTRYNTFFINNL